ncbi:MAG: cysteine desulfurase family protein [Candidatus Krumholzibacteriia bacterium]
MSAIYLDYNATTPVDPRVIAAMLPYLGREFGNPSSGHETGLRARMAVAEARAQVEALMGAQPDTVIFTGGGSESNNLALKGAALARRAAGHGDHVITTAVEHPAVTEPCRWLAMQGFRVTTVPVDADGRVDPDDVGRTLTDGTILVSIMHANNEVGTIQPVRAVADLAHARGAWVHTDAAQSVGKVPVRVDDLGVDLLSVAGHKLYAPKGVGALYVRAGVVLEPQIHGAGHERGLRAGTENVPGVVGLGMACAIVAEELAEEMPRLRELRDRLEAALTRRPGDLRVNGHPEQRLPNTSSLSFAGVDAAALVHDLRMVAASAGAACHAEDGEVSGVLAAMGVPAEWARGTLRLSVGRPTSERDVDRAADGIAAAVEERRQ